MITQTRLRMKLRQIETSPLAMTLEGLTLKRAEMFYALLLTGQAKWLMYVDQ